MKAWLRLGPTASLDCCTTPKGAASSSNSSCVVSYGKFLMCSTCEIGEVKFIAVIRRLLGAVHVYGIERCGMASNTALVRCMHGAVLGSLERAAAHICDLQYS